MKSNQERRARVRAWPKPRPTFWRFWTSFEICYKGWKKFLYAIESVFSLICASLDVKYSRKLTLKKGPEKRVKGLTLTFWRFWTKHWYIWVNTQNFSPCFLTHQKLWLTGYYREKCIKPKSKGINLNFLTILDHFWDFLKRLKKASLGRDKRF